MWQFVLCAQRPTCPGPVPWSSSLFTWIRRERFVLGAVPSPSALPNRWRSWRLWKKNRMGRMERRSCYWSSPGPSCCRCVCVCEGGNIETLMVTYFLVLSPEPLGRELKKTSRPAGGSGENQKGGRKGEGKHQGSEDGVGERERRHEGGDHWAQGQPEAQLWAAEEVRGETSGMMGQPLQFIHKWKANKCVTFVSSSWTWEDVRYSEENLSSELSKLLAEKAAGQQQVRELQEDIKALTDRETQANKELERYESAKWHGTVQMF